MSLHCPLKWMLLIPALLATATLQAEEETKWYDIEIIIFSDKEGVNIDAEMWPEQLVIEPRQNAVKLVETAAGTTTPVAGSQPTAFQRLRVEDLTLTEQAARIERARRYELLLHLGWRQPGLSEAEAKAIRISDYTRAGNTEAAAAAPLSPSYGDGTAAATEHDLFAQAETVQPGLDGYVALILARYLHIETDLVYRVPREQGVTAETDSGMGTTVDTASTMPPWPPAATEGTQSGTAYPADRANAEQLVPPSPYLNFHLQESRRMRSNEIHYLDHPMFGVIIQVRPYELAEFGEEDSAEGAAQ